jgi:RNAse (barnase) inhibitor barstar
MIDFAPFGRSEPPHAHLCTDPAAELHDALVGWERGRPAKRVGRVIRGRKCATPADFFNEAAAALQFPPYFGENWDAFADCFRDLGRFGDKAAVVVVILDADRLPAELAQSLGEVLTVCLDDVNGPEKPLKPRPLHVVLHTSAAKAGPTARRFAAAGLRFADA